MIVHYLLLLVWQVAAWGLTFSVNGVSLSINPEAAGLVSRPEEWPWSGARAHLAGEDDEQATVAPLRALIPDFAALLTGPADLATTARIERAPTIGRPLGPPEWIAPRAAARPHPCTR
jgi:hypothetical protein